MKSPLVILAILLIATNIGCCPPNSTSPSQSRIDDTEAIQVAGSYANSEYISIDSDEDFEAQGWPGSGTAEDPYLLENFRNTTYGFFIHISNTVRHFVIRGCILGLANYSQFLFRITGDFVDSLPSPIRFYNVTNANISNCMLQYCDTGINLLQCSNITIRNNDIRAQWAIRDKDGINIAIENNSIMRGTYGITLDGTQDSTIFNNTIVKFHVGIRATSESRNNTILGNRIGFCYYLNAEDDGLANQWNNSVCIGNSWSDYNGTIDYQISGEGAGVDYYPSLFSGDYEGPNMVVVSAPDSVIDIVFSPVSVEFVVDAEDPSGIDVVGMYYRLFYGAGGYSSTQYTFIEMEFQQINSTTFRYSCSLDVTSDYDHLQFALWSNDTLGFYSSEIQGIVLFNDRTYYPTWVALGGMFLFAISVVSVLGLIRRRKAKEP